MEIGSFIELQLRHGCEYHSDQQHEGMQVARLNSGRAAIWHAYRVMRCEAIWIPYYQCDTVRDFLSKKGCTIKFYHQKKGFEPVDIDQKKNEAVLLVNYYGVMSKMRMSHLAGKYDNVIIDNSQAFFAEPLQDCLNVYSCRKFVGVPDGAYVVGKNATMYLEEYPQGYSSDTSLFLLQRIEYGCEGKTYQSRMINEHRIDEEDALKMSLLTQYILDGTDYEEIKKKRRANFSTACELFGHLNRLDAKQYYDRTCVPMVYPLCVEDDHLIERLLAEKHFQGHWWSYLLAEMKLSDYEYWLSRYIIPITIDQRYGDTELGFLADVIMSNS